jgi:hypothetical protein
MGDERGAARAIAVHILICGEDGGTAARELTEAVCQRGGQGAFAGGRAAGNAYDEAIGHDLVLRILFT